MTAARQVGTPKSPPLTYFWASAPTSRRDWNKLEFDDKVERLGYIKVKTYRPPHRGKYVYQGIGLRAEFIVNDTIRAMFFALRAAQLCCAGAGQRAHWSWR
jgi:hypothetical protein